MKKYSAKIFFIAVMIVSCLAFTGTKEKISFTAGSQRMEKDNINVVINLKDNLAKRHWSKVKAKIIQRLNAGTQVCVLTDNKVSIHFQNEKRIELSFKPCKQGESMVDKSTASQKYLIDISLIHDRIESKAQGVTLPIREVFPDLFKATPAQIAQVNTNSELQETPGGKARAVTNNNQRENPVAANASSADNNEKDRNGYELQLQEFRRDGCSFLKIMVPASSELNREDVKLVQHYRVERPSSFTISDNKKRIHKEDNSFSVYFIPNTNAEFSMKFSIDVKGKKYRAENRNILVKDIKDSDECLTRLDSYFIQPPKPKPDTGFNVKSLLIPLLIVLLIGASFYTIMQYRQRKKDASKSLHKEPVATTVLPATNGEAEITFFEPGAPIASSYDHSIKLSNYTRLVNLENYYNDTAVVNVFMEKEAVKEIFDFVWASQKTRPAPEVGGFLMGRIQSNPERPGLYDVFINAFLKDMAPDFQNNVNISFSNGIAADELEYIDTHPGEEKVGWLHTHPGHGVFLSPTDIGSHFRAFPRSTQLAIVIESYDNFKTGIFSYKAGARELNNISDKSTTIDYKSWKEFI